MGKHQSRKKTKPKDIHVRKKGFLNRQDIILIAVTIIVAGAFFSLGKYFEFNSPGAFDSGSNVYSAAHILTGAKIGVEEKPSANLGTLLVNILGVKLFGFSEFGPKLIQTIMQAIALVLMFIAVRKCFCSLSAAVSVILAAIFLSSPLIAKYGNVKEQYMVACMIAGISFYILYKCYGKWPLAVLSGAILVWAPLFKATGLSAIGAMGLYLFVQFFSKEIKFKQTVREILLLVAGAAIALTPIYIWILGWDVNMSLPYLSTVTKHISQLFTPSANGSESAGNYITVSRKLVGFSQQWPRVLRYYSLFILPILLSLGAIGAGIIRFFVLRKSQSKKDYGDRFVLLLAVWWILDMAFVWISPRSYEQYYLPLNASSAMLGGYFIGLFWYGMQNSAKKKRWIIAGVVSLLVMFVMIQHVIFGISKSPHTGQSYGRKVKGYAQKFKEISYMRSHDLKYPWQQVGEYIKNHSANEDKIYVWGWFPGIYVEAQRFSSASKAFSITRVAPARLEREVSLMLKEFNTEMPSFIVDSRKRHIPTNRPPYELWPIVPKGFLGFDKTNFLPLNKQIIEAYDKQWTNLLRTQFDDDEATRYQILKPFREFVMNNYTIVRMFGEHVLFKLKEGN